MKVGSASCSEQKRSAIRKSGKRVAMNKNKAVHWNKTLEGPDVDRNVEELGREVQELIPQVQQLRMKYNELLVQNLQLRRLPLPENTPSKLPAPPSVTSPAESPVNINAPLIKPTGGPSSSQSGNAAQEELVITMPGDDLDFSDLLDEEMAPVGPQAHGTSHGPFASPSVHCQVQAAFSLSDLSTSQEITHAAHARSAGAPAWHPHSTHSQLRTAQLLPCHSAPPILPYHQPCSVFQEEQEPISSTFLFQQHSAGLPLPSTPHRFSSGPAAQGPRWSMAAVQGYPRHAHHGHDHEMHALPLGVPLHLGLLQEGDTTVEAVEYLTQMVYDPSNIGSQHIPHSSSMPAPVAVTVKPDSGQHPMPSHQQRASIPILSSHGVIMHSLQQQMASKDHRHAGHAVKQEQWQCAPEPSPHRHQPSHQQALDQGLPLLDVWETDSYGICSKDAFNFNPSMFDDDVCFINANEL